MTDDSQALWYADPDLRAEVGVSYDETAGGPVPAVRFLAPDGSTLGTHVVPEGSPEGLARALAEAQAFVEAVQEAWAVTTTRLSATERGTVPSRPPARRGLAVSLGGAAACATGGAGLSIAGLIAFLQGEPAAAAGYYALSSAARWACAPFLASAAAFWYRAKRRTAFSPRVHVSGEEPWVLPDARTLRLRSAVYVAAGPGPDAGIVPAAEAVDPLGVVVARIYPAHPPLDVDAAAGEVAIAARGWLESVLEVQTRAREIGEAVDAVEAAVGREPLPP